ncbi:hypothetical protein KCU95_g29, partial [Aureobasidium melanogenum]
MQGYIQEVTQTAIDYHCPKAKPSKYAKRWWSNDLTSMRKEYTKARNLARSRRRQGRRDDNLEIAAKIARHDFHHAIKKRKKEHWTEFLEPPIPQRPERTRDAVADRIFDKELTIDEIEKALFSASPDKAAGSDGLTIRARQTAVAMEGGKDFIGQYLC